MDKKSHPGSELNHGSGSGDCMKNVDREREKTRAASAKDRDLSPGNRTPKSFGTPCHVR